MHSKRQTQGRTHSSACEAERAAGRMRPGLHVRYLEAGAVLGCLAMITSLTLS